jgi:hypothetical protein
LAAKQIAAIDADDVGMMSANQFIALKQTQLRALTTGQVGKLDSAKVLTITAKNIASLSYLQIQHFSDEVVTNLSGQQLGALTKQQIATGLDGRKIGLLSADQVKGFNKVQIQALTYPQVAALSVEDLMALSNTQLTAFKLDQISNFTNAQITWVHDNKIDAGFTKGQLNKINERYAANPPPPPPPAYTLGQAVIDLGEGNGKLIAPVQVEGKWYYFWDRSGNGDSNGADSTTHHVLNEIFGSTLEQVTNSSASTLITAASGSGTTDITRYAIINGVKLALATANGGTPYPQPINGYQNSTAYTDAGATSNGTTSSFNELLAIWDAYNGTGVNQNGINGVPPGWSGLPYWSATPSAAGHAYIYLNGGFPVGGGDQESYNVALQVLPPT